VSETPEPPKPDDVLRRMLAMKPEPKPPSPAKKSKKGIHKPDDAA
jgi:hypothetical protein